MERGEINSMKGGRMDRVGTDKLVVQKGEFYKQKDTEMSAKEGTCRKKSLWYKNGKT
jgi:hypothetical protein